MFEAMVTLATMVKIEVKRSWNDQKWLKNDQNHSKRSKTCSSIVYLFFFWRKLLEILGNRRRRQSASWLDVPSVKPLKVSDTIAGQVKSGQIIFYKINKAIASELRHSLQKLHVHVQSKWRFKPPITLVILFFFHIWRSFCGWYYETIHVFMFLVPVVHVTWQFLEWKFVKCFLLAASLFGHWTFIFCHFLTVIITTSFTPFYPVNKYPQNISPILVLDQTW